MGSQSEPNNVWFLFAHGAGAPSTSPWMKHYGDILREFGPVRSFDYPYMSANRKRSDPLAKLIEAHRRELTIGAKEHGPNVILAGKSMGGRVGCHLALHEPVRGVICFGYPLIGAGKSKSVRDQVLLDLTAPACFLQGTRDPLCPLPEFRAVLAARKAKSYLHVVESGDHSLVQTKTHLKQQGRTAEDLRPEITHVVATFLSTL